jgi:hypothetical protein
MRIYRLFSIIFIIEAVFSRSIEIKTNNESYELNESIESQETSEMLDCDSYFVESQDSLLGRFLIRHNLQYYYVKRNENYEACLQFLDKFISLIDLYRREHKDHNDFIITSNIHKRPITY